MSSNIDKKGACRRGFSRRHYDKEFIKQIVESIEKGKVRSAITREYGIAKTVLSGWMRDYGSPGYHASKKGHLSLQEKRSIVRAIEEGRMTIYEARVAYRVNSAVTITKWLKESKRENAELVASNETLMAKKEQNQQEDPDSKKALAEALKKLAEAELKVKALNTLIDVAEEQFKISIRKKAGAKQSKE
jgi:transposase-like protein